MSELRTDWLTGRTVIVAENRADRPNEFTGPFGKAANTASRLSSTCPFCLGQEYLTPPAVYQANDEHGQWQVRVVPNMFPAVTSDYNFRFHVSHPLAPVQSVLVEPSFGAHEVIVESSRHIDRTSLLTAVELQTVLLAYADRLQHWRDVHHFQYGLIFKNQGVRAGASMGHLHSQFIALPEVPPAVRDELDRAEQQYLQQHLCAYCQLIAAERKAGERIVLDRDGYVSFCPFASSQPLEIWLLPSDHQPSFEEFTEQSQFQRLAEVLHALIARLEAILPEPAYNVVLRTAPWHAENGTYFHWRIELLPRVAEWAGLELATGVRINPISPEHAAEKLRSI